MAGFNTIGSSSNFTDDVEREMDFKFYNIKSKYASIYDGYTVVNKSTNGGAATAQVSVNPAMGQSNDIAMNFGNGDNGQSSFEPQVHIEQQLNYSAAEVYATRAANRGRSRLTGFLRKLPALPGKALRSILGKRSTSSASAVQEPTKAPTEHSTKRRRDNNGGTVPVRTASYDTIAGTSPEYFDQQGYCIVDFDQSEFRGLTALNRTNENTKEWKRPQRKEWTGVWGIFQPAEDDSWDIDPRTGHKIPKARV